MSKVNSNYFRLSKSYLFSEIANRIKAFQVKHPGVAILRLGMGNTTQALPPTIVKGLRLGVDKLASAETYTGYGDEQGDLRLRQALSKWYGARGIKIDPVEVFISDGAKPDSANIQSLFNEKSVIAVQDPAYPVYIDAAIVNGHKVVFMPATEQDGFVPSPPNEKVDIVYLCSPNNPTGAVMNKKQLKAFVDYAVRHHAVIIFDAAYFAFIQDSKLPRSIYEIPNAKKCAIEINSFSKMAGFTGVRLGWTVVPNELLVMSSRAKRGDISEIATSLTAPLNDNITYGTIRSLWLRRQTTMFNGASNIAQEGGLAVLSKEGWTESMEIVNYYMKNAKIIKDALVKLGLTVYGGDNAPYIWLKVPVVKGSTLYKVDPSQKSNSWEFFDKLLNECHVVVTPGVGFGPSGEGYVRLSAFGHKEDIEQAVASIEKNLKIS